MTLEIITTPSLAPLRHGFFTRRGGASSGVFAGLNCGPGSTDQSEIVAINRARVAEAMGVNAEDLVTVHQVHSPDVLTITGPLNGARPKADALVSATPGIALAVLTADCQPGSRTDQRVGLGARAIQRPGDRQHVGRMHLMHGHQVF
ncbi:MAG: laccase domain-containing protein, partial [Paracoccaceae bacterium]|nr:laccase domain-containing protein [Paracoccaceae bacterium]